MKEKICISGKKFRSKLVSNGLNVRSFSMKLGVSRVTVYNWINGRPIEAHNLEDVITLLCCSKEDILDKIKN